jgi:hypothetical protein
MHAARGKRLGVGIETVRGGKPAGVGRTPREVDDIARQGARIVNPGDELSRLLRRH